MLYKLSFYVPVSHLESVKSTLFAEGAGSYLDYDQCCWQVLGEGQYRPLAGSDAFLGTTGCLEKLTEYKVEILCSQENIKAVVASLLRIHPYQQPAYGIFPMLTIDDL